jgi:hypothetical protein
VQFDQSCVSYSTQATPTLQSIQPTAEQEEKAEQEEIIVANANKCPHYSLLEQRRYYEEANIFLTLSA